ncbi:MAG TPA: flagellar hook protein FlgE [Alphaproteobacteria bacterium]|nr:flagellar hook protein FlgE [Alphaproteobacteria bacterium]
MSLFAALTVAVGGLNAQSAAIGNVSDNISNAQTVGFKRIDTNFKSLVTQSNLSLNDPGGVRATPLYENSLQGNLVQSQNSTSLAISGAGFFDVRKQVNNADGSTTILSEDLYTRQGDFSSDRNGYLVNSSGYVLAGYSVDNSGNVDTSEVIPIQISALLDNPVPTSSVTYNANLPASAVGGTQFSESTVQVFDALGTKHVLHLQWTKDSVTANTWELDVTPDDATATANFVNYDGTSVSAGASIGTQRIKFTFGDGTGGTTAGTISTIDQGSSNGNFYTITADAAPDHTATFSFPATFAGAGSQTIALNFGKYNTAAGLTQYDSTEISVSSLEQNGIPRGSFQDLSIDTNGFIHLNYDNGSQRTLYQIPLVQFNSPNELQRVSGGAFSRTEESGTPRISAPGSVGAGTIAGNTLEGSNVDIADEFTKMIQAQRVYSANARTITTTDEMLQDVINIIR